VDTTTGLYPECADNRSAVSLGHRRQLLGGARYYLATVFSHRWLDYSFARVFSQALRRTARRIITRERLYAGNRETVRNALFDTDGIPWWVIRTHGKRRRDFPELFKCPEYGHAAVIQLDRPAAAEAFLVAVSARSWTTDSGQTQAD
jgi:hypothetical protein